MRVCVMAGEAAALSEVIWDNQAGWLREVKARESMTMYSFDVSGMSCSHCAAAVTRSVQSIDQMAQVKVDLAANRVEVESRLEREKVAAAITEAGYPVTAARG
jgi:copper chaperone